MSQTMPCDFCGKQVKIRFRFPKEGVPDSEANWICEECVTAMQTEGLSLYHSLALPPKPLGDQCQICQTPIHALEWHIRLKGKCMCESCSKLIVKYYMIKRRKEKQAAPLSQFM